jgi:hypothetical protein
LTAAVGVATLDATGPLCHDGCGETKRIEVSSLVTRTLLIAGIADRLAWNPGGSDVSRAVKSGGGRPCFEQSERC